MSKKIYKTAQGKIVDLGALQVQNETVRAVGNMNVNARGDRLDADGNIIATRLL
jgi:predicted amidohydrolase